MGERGGPNGEPIKVSPAVAGEAPRPAFSDAEPILDSTLEPGVDKRLGEAINSDGPVDVEEIPFDDNGAAEVHSPQTSTPETSKAQAEPILTDQLINQVRQKAAEFKAANPGATEEEAYKRGVGAIMMQVGNLTSDDPAKANAARDNLLGNTTFSGEDAADARNQFLAELAEFVTNDTSRAEKLQDMNATLRSGQSAPTEPAQPAPEAQPEPEVQAQPEPIFMTKLAELAKARAATLRARGMPEDQANKQAAHDVMVAVRRASSTDPRIAEPALDTLLGEEAFSGATAEETNALHAQFRSEFLGFVADTSTSKTKKMNGLREDLEKSFGQAESSEPEAHLPPVEPDSQTEPEKQSSKEPWTVHAGVLNFRLSDVKKVIDWHAQSTPDEWEQILESLVTSKYYSYTDQFTNEEFDALDHDAVRKEFRDAYENLIAQSGEIPQDDDVAWRELEDYYEQQEAAEELGETKVGVKLTSKFRNLGTMLRKLPYGIVVKTQLAWRGSLGKIKNEKLRTKVASVGGLALGVGVLILMRSVMDSGEDVSGASAAAATGVGETPSPMPEATPLATPSPEASSVPTPEASVVPTPSETATATPETQQTPPQVVEQEPPVETPTRNTDYKPNSSSWWGIAEDLLRTARNEGDIDSLDGSKRQTLIEALQTANPEGIDKNGMDVTSALEAIEKMKAEDASAAQTVEVGTTIYEAQRGDTIEEITDKLFQAYGIDNPNEQLRSEVEQSLIDNNYTYNGSEHWIDEGQNIHLEEAKGFIEDFLKTEEVQTGADFADNNVELSQPEEQVAEAVSNVEPVTQSDGAEKVTLDLAMAEVANREDANEIANVYQGEDWQAALRREGIPLTLSAMILSQIGPDLVKAGYAEKVPTYNNKFTVGRRPVTKTVIDGIKKAALRLTKR